MSSILDVNGNINTDKLSKELRAALDADVKYKQTDNMKKRACRTAADYDQFKAMVECAHLKKLTRPEVESLSHVKKGWQKKVTKDNSSSAVLLSEELQKLEMINGANKIDHSVVANRKPKTPMEMDRDLRRIVNTEEKLRYLIFIGLKKAKTVLAKPGTDTELLETLLNILLSNEGLARTRLELQNTNTKSKSDQLENESKENGAADSETSVFDLKCLGKWLKALTVMDKFDLNIRFVTKTTIQSVVRILEELNLNSLQSTLDLYKSVQ